MQEKETQHEPNTIVHVCVGRRMMNPVFVTWQRWGEKAWVWGYTLTSCPSESMWWHSSESKKLVRTCLQCSCSPSLTNLMLESFWKFFQSARSWGCFSVESAFLTCRYICMYLSYCYLMHILSTAGISNWFCLGVCRSVHLPSNALQPGKLTA